MIVVLDTNVVVSALLSPFGPPGRVVDMVQTGDLVLAFDDRALIEYRQVLSRDRFGFDPADVAALLEFVEVEGTKVIARPWPHPLPDPDDTVFVEVAAAVGAPLITGNQRHYPAERCPGVDVLTPADFLRRWRDQHGPPRT